MYAGLHNWCDPVWIQGAVAAAESTMFLASAKIQLDWKQN